MVIKGPRKKAETSKAGAGLFDPSGEASCLLFAKLLLPVVPAHFLQSGHSHWSKSNMAYWSVRRPLPWKLKSLLLGVAYKVTYHLLFFWGKEFYVGESLHVWFVLISWLTSWHWRATATRWACAQAILCWLFLLCVSVIKHSVGSLKGLRYLVLFPVSEVYAWCQGHFEKWNMTSGLCPFPKTPSQLLCGFGGISWSSRNAKGFSVSCWFLLSIPVDRFLSCCLDSL